MGCCATKEEVLLEHAYAAQLPKQPINNGAAVRIVGLSGRPELNGQVGVVSGFVVESGRLIVKISAAETVALRRDNLVVDGALPAGTMVQIFGLQASPQNNGLVGSVVSFHTESGRNRVRLQDGRELAVKADNLMVAPATKATKSAWSTPVHRPAPALMPTGGNQGTVSSDSALGDAYTTGGRAAPASRAAVMRNENWGRSAKSQQVLSDLSSIEVALQTLRARAQAINAELVAAAGSAPPGVQSKIASLHGEARTLLETRVDAVLTGSLNSGREKARFQKKELAKQAGELIDQLEELNRQLSNTEPELVVVDAEPVTDENEPTVTVPMGEVVLEEGIQVVVGEWVD